LSSQNRYKIQSKCGSEEKTPHSLIEGGDGEEVEQEEKQF
jgi:hypothetical protein